MSNVRRDPLTGLPYPSSPITVRFYRMPILLWRLGLGPLIGRFLMLVTTTGRRSGLPRRAVVEYHEYGGRKYILSGWGEHAQWYKNIQADPRVTIQTADGAESVTARRLQTDEELEEAYRFVEANPAFQRWVLMLGFDMTQESFFERRDDLYILTFDPTGEPTPPPLEPDLRWVLPVVIGSAVSLALLLLYQRQREG